MVNDQKIASEQKRRIAFMGEFGAKRVAKMGSIVSTSHALHKELNQVADRRIAVAMNLSDLQRKREHLPNGRGQADSVQREIAEEAQFVDAQIALTNAEFEALDARYKKLEKPYAAALQLKEACFREIESRYAGFFTEHLYQLAGWRK